MMKSYWLQSGFFTLLDKLTQMAFNLGGILILLRLLDKQTSSAWALFLTVTAFIEIGRTGLLQNGMVTFLTTSEKQEHPKILSASLFLNLSLSTLCVIGLIIGSFLIRNVFDYAELPLLLRIYAATTFVFSALYQFNFVQQANLDYKGLFVAGFVKNGILFAYIVYLAVLKKEISLTNLAICQLISAFPSALVAYGMARKYLIFSKLDWNWVRKLFDYGKFTFGTNIATMTYKSVDKLMLGGLLKDMVSTYDVAIRVNNIAEVPTTTLATILFPQSAKRNHAEGASSSKYLYEKSVGVLLGLILPMVVFILVFADWIVKIIGGAKFAASAPTLRLTIFYGVFMAFAIQFGTMLDAIGKPKVNFYITTLGAMVNLICNYLFIKQFGFYGACYGTLTAMTIMFLIMQITLNRMIGVQTLQCFAYIMPFYKDIFFKIKGFFTKKQPTNGITRNESAPKTVETNIKKESTVMNKATEIELTKSSKRRLYIEDL
jgi:O-antigen/teichoic acid export membrane protein